MASQQPIRFSCKTCGPLDADKFSPTQISFRVREEDRGCMDCKEKAAAAKKAKSQLERLTKHAERVAFILPEGAADPSMSYKRGSDGSIKGVIRQSCEFHGTTDRE